MNNKYVKDYAKSLIGIWERATTLNWIGINEESASSGYTDCLKEADYNFLFNPATTALVYKRAVIMYDKKAILIVTAADLDFPADIMMAFDLIRNSEQSSFDYELNVIRGYLESLKEASL